MCTFASRSKLILKLNENKILPQEKVLSFLHAVATLINQKIYIYGNILFI